jgi:selenocysteine-specific elongation factor
VIVATAGHVDHGKTALVKALTGIDTDRLPEEKRRAMTIDLGFAYLPLAAGATIGFIDVPGHERFIRNMLCGVAGIDFVLLIVAADDGPMPQTREHLAIVDLLGVRRGAVALTKTDRVPPERAGAVAVAVAALLTGTSVAGAPVFPVSSVTGAGVPALKAHLAAAAAALERRRAGGNFRLAVDRCFTLAGAGLVVTGTVHAGIVAVGDRVTLVPGGQEARVRSIHAQNARAAVGRAGERCALNLAATTLAHGDIHRGDWIVGAAAPATAKIDAMLRVVASEARKLAHWTPVHVHLGAAEATGRVAMLEGAAIAPGEKGLVQLVLDRPIGAVWGDGVIVRDQSAQRTIGGGRVIDVFAPPRGRARPARLAWLKAMALEDEAAALTALLADAAGGLDLARFAANRNLTPGEAAALQARVAMIAVATEAGAVGFAPARWAQLKEEALAALAAWHRRAADSAGPALERLWAGTTLRLPHDLTPALATELAREGKLVREGATLRLPTHAARLDGADAALWKRTAPLLEREPLRPPAVHDLAAALGEDPRRLESFLVRATRLGLVVRASKHRFFRPAALRHLGAVAEELAAANGARAVTAAAFRDRAGIGRNSAIELLEFFDRIRFTRRIGDAHVIERSAAEMFGGP